MSFEEFVNLQVEEFEDSNIPTDAIKIPIDNIAGINKLAGETLKAFKELNHYKGTVKMSYDLKPNETLQKSLKGGLTGNIIDKNTKEITGHVNLENISEVTAVTSSVMSVLSIVTSQYYLNEINKSLDYMQIKLDNVAKFLETDKRSHLKAREHYIKDIQSNLIDIQFNGVESQSVLTQIQNLEIESYSDYYTYNEMITGLIGSMDAVKKQDELLDIIEKLKEYLPLLWSALYLYTNSKYLRLLLSGSSDKERIEKLYNELSEMIELYEKQFEEYYVKSYDNVSDNSIFKTNEYIFNAAKMIGGGPGGIAGVYFKNKTVEGIRNLVHEKKDDDKKDAITNLFDVFYYTCKDTEPMKKICEDIKFYNTLYNEHVEYIFNDEDIFIIQGKEQTT